MMWKRFFGVGLLACLFAPVAPAGSIFTEGVGPKKVVATPMPDGMNVHVRGRMKAVRWVARSGRTTVERFPGSVDLSQVDALIAPPGEWADMVIELDGPMQLVGTNADGGQLQARLHLAEWTIAFDEPLSSDGTAGISVALTLPDWVSDKVAGAPNGQLVVDTGHPLYPALALAIQDGAVAH